MATDTTQNLKLFLTEMSEEARAYYFPGSGKEDLPLIEEATLFSEYHVFHSGMSDMKACQKEDSALSRKHKASLKSGRMFALITPKRKAENPEPPVTDLEPGEKTKAILAEIEALQRKYGVTIEELEIALAYKVKLSRLHITGKKEILLEDFDRKEVKMDTLTKAVFFLYLRHPEGIRYKELSDYQQELEEIYSSITGREDLVSIRKSVADLCDPLNNSINEKVSKVKKAFRDAVDDRVARFYYIDGAKGTAKRIALDRDFVIWK